MFHNQVECVSQVVAGYLKFAQNVQRPHDETFEFPDVSGRDFSWANNIPHILGRETARVGARLKWAAAHFLHLMPMEPHRLQLAHLYISGSRRRTFGCRRY